MTDKRGGFRRVSGGRDRSLCIFCKGGLSFTVPLFVLICQNERSVKAGDVFNGPPAVHGVTVVVSLVNTP
jgi:hypothetical protein